MIVNLEIAYDSAIPNLTNMKTEVLNAYVRNSKQSIVSK